MRVQQQSSEADPQSTVREVRETLSRYIEARERMRRAVADARKGLDEAQRWLQDHRGREETDRHAR